MKSTPTDPPTIVLGVTGSIAAFKAADLTSKLRQRNFTVNVIMTDAATKLVCPQTFFTLSQQPVITSLWDSPAWQPTHISLAERASLLVIAPASADIIAKLAQGIADDALSTFAISHTGPFLVFPAMNPRMWTNLATQENVQTLIRRGIQVVEPASGHVACGESGQGRFPEVPQILDYICAKMALLNISLPKELVAKPPKVVISAGPTREAVDPVRFLSNKSTGKMGFALANAAAVIGCEVVLIAGPVELATPLRVRRINVVTAAEMKNAVTSEFENADLVIMSAAVADYRPSQVYEQKIHKSGDMNLHLERTEDILLSLKDMKKENQRVVGFAAETENVEQSARSKMERKGLDMIVSNDVSRPDIGFASSENEVTIYMPGEEPIPVPKQSKTNIATSIFEVIFSKFFSK
ncbi:Coenzyme A biosynthesis bifunctional protein CoaBC [Tritrichomonas foetus]|uniref:Coenzyme A biosynthesis bifunctional protein CoaBC n=1 Tax=Tritrichomonas foetus TaxID=1144522 RepID=A0A1J4KSD2_9EUKA|nr:Coenzyme A biosynthesis bifunctional protein CoaBC [Tritrichomonas foetus]|eukprot:OHT12574.1 Coenzyme A biosynthesis bifunctional protein CoaBC [Tritrichomonas foetus]